jgi:hypothetical protein
LVIDEKGLPFIINKSNNGIQLNGTNINDIDVKKALSNGDVITIGGRNFKFESSATCQNVKNLPASGRAVHFQENDVTMTINNENVVPQKPAFDGRKMSTPLRKSIEAKRKDATPSATGTVPRMGGKNLSLNIFVVLCM